MKSSHPVSAGVRQEGNEHHGITSSVQAHAAALGVATLIRQRGLGRIPAIHPIRSGKACLQQPSDLITLRPGVVTGTTTPASEGPAEVGNDLHRRGLAIDPLELCEAVVLEDPVRRQQLE